MSPTLSSAAPAPRRRPGGPPRWTAADKTAALAAFATSGLSLKAFCLARGVPRATFTLWQREARAARTTPNVSHEVAPEVPRVAPRAPRRRRDRPTFATVELVPAPTPRGIPRVVAQGLVLLVRGPAGIEAELTGLDAATVVTVVTVVGAILAPRRERMIGLASGRPIFLATGVTDLRRGVSGLYALILDQLAQEPLSGAIFGFCNRRRDRTI